ncbi:hypothetical protein V5E97_09530 [Singulisphaera sp. Ch08]|uniref:Uncharacterized protein n=1 Tax=Singulisphaera sp. Ch08 TaxID=3120278 RepID=A0AAU7CMW9_9BACT
MEESRLYEVQLRRLRLIRDATAAGLICWQRSEDDQDYFNSVSDLIATYIQFRFPSYNDDVGSDRDYVRIGEDRFMIGTPGWWLVVEILAAGLPDWRNHLQSIFAHYEFDIRRLTTALEHRGT